LTKWSGLFLAGFSAVVASAPAAEKYELDLTHSYVGFQVKHLMVSNVKGYFKDYSGTITYDPKDISKSSIDVTIKAASIDTNQAKRDEHLRGPDFFDAQKYPDITFKSKKIEIKGDGYVATGALTMKGVSKDIELPFTLTGPVKGPGGKNKIGAEASGTINRQDYGVSWNKTLDGGGVVVSDAVKLSIDVQADAAK